MKLQVLYDCDNTIGVNGKDIDDGLTLLYLTGRDDVEIRGVTGVFGNGCIDDVCQATGSLIREFELTGIDFYRGAGEKGELNTTAAGFLVQQVESHPGQLNLLATGPLTNIKAAQLKDEDFLGNLKSITVMGGITEPLVFADRKMDELNFSCDPEAAQLVLQAGVPVMVASGNLCLQALFSDADWEKLRSELPFLVPYIKEWYHQGDDIIGHRGFYMWDLVAAVYVTHPEMFVEQRYLFKSELQDLKQGKLMLEKTDKPATEPGVINLPREIRDIKEFKELIFNTWSRL